VVVKLKKGEESNFTCLRVISKSGNCGIGDANVGKYTPVGSRRHKESDCIFTPNPCLEYRNF
jgi:hypothetical protein